MLILVSTTIGATFIATSRIVDGSHFPVQVVGGSILGACGTLFIVASPLILPNTPLGGNNKKKDGMDVELAQNIDRWK